MVRSPVDPKLPEGESPVFPPVPYSHCWAFGEKADSRVRRIFCLPLLLPGPVTVGVLMSLVSFRNSQCYSEVQRYAC